MIAKNKLPIVFVIAVILLIGFIVYRQKQATIPTETPKNLEAELLPFINPKNDPDVIFDINKTVGNFSYISIGSKSGPGVATIWKKEGEKWRGLLSTQDAWECDIVMKENIPPALIDNSCFYYKTQEAWKYNTELNKWEKK